MMSSTGTLTVRVCTCDRDGNMEMCNAEALSGTAGLSTGALVAILLCVLILLCKYHTHREPKGEGPGCAFSSTARSDLSPSAY